MARARETRRHRVRGTSRAAQSAVTAPQKESRADAEKTILDLLKAEQFGLVASANALASSSLASGREGAIEAMGYIVKVIAEVQPRDPMETMLAHQMIVTHARAMTLSRLSMAENEPTARRLFSEEYERASNLYRRQMLAFHEYRQPPRRAFVSVRHANIAGQQLVQQQIEGGLEDAYETLSVDTGRPQALAAGCPTKSALASIDGAENRSRQTAVIEERTASRPPIERIPRDEARPPADAARRPRHARRSGRS
jgi:hypothetical protein